MTIDSSHIETVFHINIGPNERIVGDMATQVVTTPEPLSAKI